MGLPNGQNLQDLFNQRFGANAYQNGVNSAQQAGQNYYNSLMQAKIQAQMQQDFINQQKQQAALQKPINDQKNAADYWNQNKDALLQKGAYRAVQDLQNDPELQAQLKSQGYDVKALADQAYNVATGGKIKSASGFKSMYNDLNNQTNQMHADQKAKTGTDWKTLFDQQATKHAQQYGDTYDQQQKTLANETMAQVGQNGQNAQLNQTQNAVANSGVGSFGDEVQRGLARGLNAATLGLPELAREKLGMGPSEMLMNRNGSAGMLDKGYDFAGQALPFLLSDGATSALGLGKGMAEKGIMGQLGQSAVKNAVNGGLVSAGVQGVNAAIDPSSFNWQNFGKQLALDTTLGGVGGAALHGLGMLGGKVLDNSASKLYQDLNLSKSNPEAFTPGTAANDALTQEFKGMTQSQIPATNLKFTLPSPRPMISGIPDSLQGAHGPATPGATISNIADNTLNNVSNNNWFSPAAQAEHPAFSPASQTDNPMLNFAQPGNSNKIAQTRGMLQDTSVPKSQSGAIRSSAENTLNTANTFTNAPPGGFNQRLLDVQKDMHASSQTNAAVKQEMQNAIQQQYEHLKGAGGKGTDSGIYTNGKAGNFKEATGGRYSVSNNPKWYQDFYKATGRAPSDKELKQIAEIHVRNGFQDHLGNIPAWKPQDLQHTHDQIDEIHTMLQAHPEQAQRLTPILKSLEQDEARLTAAHNNALSGKTPGINELYSGAKGANDPKSFDQLIKMAQMEHNGSTSANVSVKPNMKQYLKADPAFHNQVKQQLQQLSDLGKPAVKAPKVEVPTPAAKQAPKDLLQGLYTDRGPKTLGNNMPKFGDVMKGLTDQKKYVLDTVKTGGKNISSMSAKELTNVAAKLEKQHELVSQGGKGSAEKLAAIESDMAKVKQAGLKMNLQFFAEHAKANPIEAVREKIFGKSPDKTPQDVAKEKAIAKSKQDNAVKKFEDKGNTLKADAAKTLENSDNWKNKNMFSMNRETPTRVFEDVMGKDAPTMIKKYIDPIKSSEADRVRFLNEERGKVKDLGIKAGSKEDALVQQLGEGKVTLDEVKQQAPKSWEKIAQAKDYLRNFYDQILPKINEVLKANGEKEIPMRADYFPHFQEIDGIMHQLGFDMHNHALPTEINGLTANFKPQKNWTSFAQRRTGDETAFGGVQGFDKYIEGASNLIHHTPNIKNLRALEDAVRTKYEGDTHLNNFAAWIKEFTNQLAGKKSEADRGLESSFGRGVFNVLDTLKKRTGMNMVGANIGSAMTNFIPLTQALATTSKPAFLKGLTETMANLGKDDGFVHASDFLTKREGSNTLYKTWADKTIKKSMWFMKVADDFASQVIVRGKYNEGIAKGLSEEDAIKQADTWAERVMAGRAKGDMPNLMGSKTLGMMTQFQLEVNNELSFLFKDLPRNAFANSETKAKAIAQLSSHVGQIMLYGYLYNNINEQITGKRPAIDPIGVAKQAYEEYSNSRLKSGTATQNLIGNIISHVPVGDQIAYQLGLSTKTARMPFQSALPSVGNIVTGKSTIGKEMLNPLTYLTLPTGGGAIKKAVEGLSAYNAGGVYNGKGNLMYPIDKTPANAVRGALFGKSSFPGANAYYNNNESPLSAQETQQVQSGTRDYQSILQQRHNADLMKKIKEVQKNGGDPNKIDKLMSQIKN